jgi:hypothetical protein
VVTGVTAALVSFDGGCVSWPEPESVADICRGWLVTASLPCVLCGEVDRCGVMTSFGIPVGGRTGLAASLERLAAGVKGGEWTADEGGEGCDEALPEPGSGGLLDAETTWNCQSA